MICSSFLINHPGTSFPSPTATRYWCLCLRVLHDKCKVDVDDSKDNCIASYLVALHTLRTKIEKANDVQKTKKLMIILLISTR